MRELTKEVVFNEDTLIDFGLELSYHRYIIDQVRENNSRSIENAGFALATDWWDTCGETIEQKYKVLIEAIRATGNKRAVKKWEEKLVGRPDTPISIDSEMSVMDEVSLESPELWMA